MFKVTGGGNVYPDLTGRQAASKARALRRTGLNDVEIYKPNGDRISLYSLQESLRKDQNS